MSGYIRVDICMLLQTCVLMKVYVVKVDSFGIHKYMMPRLVFGGV